MKNDYSFKLTAGVILAGVILAFVNPAEAARSPNGHCPTKPAGAPPLSAESTTVTVATAAP